MGPFQEHEEKKSPEKASPRSRIPRLILHPPFRPKGKGSPPSELPLSEEESKDCDVSSEHSKRTNSPNSFPSDDTGCPSSQSVSPAKTPSGSENSPLGSPSPGERKTKVKRVRVDVMAEWSAPTPRHKREQRSSKQPRGSEADFSSSSSAGSIKTRESLATNSTGKKAHSHSRGAHIRILPVFKPACSPTAPRDAQLYAPYRMCPKAPSSTNSSSNSSPTTRRAKSGRYHSCGDNHGIKPPNPEQYLTPLQQKEVAIRHLRSNLSEAELRVQDRETDIEELKTQLGRMREDWIEEECHRVEAQLSLKEARKEIKQLRQVVETMKNSLMEKDRGIQKYFIDINIQNRKLESLLHSMEVAQSGSSLQDEHTLDFICDSPDLSATGGKLDEELQLAGQAAEEMVDSGMLVEMSNQTHTLEEILTSTAMDSSAKLGPQPGPFTLAHSVLEKSSAGESPALTEQSAPEDKAVQTDEVSYTPDLQAVLQLLKLQGGGVAGSMLPSSSQLPEFSALQGSSFNLTYSTSSDPAPTALVTPKHPDDAGLCCSKPAMGPRFMEELDFAVKEETCSTPAMVVGKSYWSNSFLVDLVAVAAPVLPTVAWLYSRHGVDGGAPVYNIAALIRGCCVMGLHSLRHVTHGPDI